MSNYFIQDDTVTAWADHARRISRTTETLNAAEIAEIFSRVQGDIKTDGKYLVEAIDAGGEVEKFGMYDTGEIFAFPKMSKSLFLQTSFGYETFAKFDKWVTTSPINNGFIVVHDSPIMAGALYKPMDNFFIIDINIENDNTTISIRIGAKEINWGDGVSDVNLEEYYIRDYTHTYTSAGKYLIKIPKITHKIQAMFLDSTTQLAITGFIIPKWVEVFNGLDNLINLQYILFEDGVKFTTNSNFPDGNVTLQENSSLEYICLPNSFLNSSNSLPDRFLYNSGIKRVLFPYGIATIPRFCFSNCTSLTDIVIPNTVTSIGEGAFSNCTSLTNIIIPNSVTSIGESAFADCASLTDIVIPNTVTSIGEYAFSDCCNLTHFVMPSNITSIPPYCFHVFSAIKICADVEFILPSVTYIGDYAFYNRGYFDTGKITLVLQTDNICTLGTGVFDYDGNQPNRNICIYVQDNLVDSYKADSNWSAYADYIKPISEYTGEV